MPNATERTDGNDAVYDPEPAGHTLRRTVAPPVSHPPSVRPARPWCSQFVAVPRSRCRAGGIPANHLACRAAIKATSAELDPPAVTVPASTRAPTTSNRPIGSLPLSSNLCDLDLDLAPTFNHVIDCFRSRPRLSAICASGWMCMQPSFPAAGILNAAERGGLDHGAGPLRHTRHVRVGDRFDLSVRAALGGGPIGGHRM